jgi:hypothetical protein
VQQSSFRWNRPNNRFSRPSRPQPSSQLEVSHVLQESQLSFLRKHSRSRSSRPGRPQPESHELQELYELWVVAAQPLLQPVLQPLLQPLPPPASNAVVINTKAAFTIHTPSGITDASKPLSGAAGTPHREKARQHVDSRNVRLVYPTSGTTPEVPGNLGKMLMISANVKLPL